MTASIIRLDGQEAYDLLFPEHLAMLPSMSQETMHRSMLNSSRVWMGMDGDKIIGLWGLISPTLMSDIAYLWLFTTKHLQGNTFIFIRHSQRAVQDMLKEFPIIVGHTAINNHSGQQWLRWLGAEFGEPINDIVVPFTIKAK
jgi:hypothetical protein